MVGGSVRAICCREVMDFDLGNGMAHLFEHAGLLKREYQ